MVIRTRTEALSALSEILELERAEQIMRMTVALAECVSPEARQILNRALQGLVDGRLETRVRKRPVVAPTPEVLEPLPPDAGPINDELVVAELKSAIEAIKSAAVAIDVFPSLRDHVARWEVARAALQGATEFKRLVTKGLAGNNADSARALLSLVRRARPWWHSEVPTVTAACERAWRESPPSKWRVGAHTLLDVVATTELRAMYATSNIIPNVHAMNEPLAKIAATVTRLVQKQFPAGLPADSALQE